MGHSSYLVYNITKSYALKNYIMRISNSRFIPFSNTLSPCQPYMCMLFYGPKFALTCMACIYFHMKKSIHMCIYQTQKRKPCKLYKLLKNYISKMCKSLCFENVFIMHVIIGIEPTFCKFI